MIVRAPKFSYSKLNTYDSCGFKYKLTYEDQHFIFTDSLATELGTLIHYIEEHIALEIISGRAIDYDKFKKDFEQLNIPKTSPKDLDGGIFGTNILQQKYPEDFFKVDENGKSYEIKCQEYLDHGIYRLEKFLKENPNIELKTVEQFFSINYNGFILSGYIDRILYDKENDIYIIEDLKTKDHPFKEQDLITPLQFVIYTLAAESIYDVGEDKITCAYNLPLCDLRQSAGTKGYIARGKKKLDKIFDGISNKDFEPHPSPLCHWCQFCPHNPTQPDGGKNLCPYYSLWTPTDKNYKVAHEWEGIEKNDIIIQQVYGDKNFSDFDF